MSIIGTIGAVAGKLLSETAQETGAEFIVDAFKGKKGSDKTDPKSEPSPKEIKAKTKEDNNRYRILVASASQRYRGNFSTIITQFIDYLYKHRPDLTTKYVERVKLTVWPETLNASALKRRAKKFYHLPIIAHLGNAHKLDQKGAELAVKEFCEKSFEEMADDWALWSEEEESALTKTLITWHRFLIWRRSNKKTSTQSVAPGGTDIRFKLGLR